MSQLDFSSILNYVQNSSSFFVILGEKASFDEQLAGCSLFLALKKAGKNASLLSPKQFVNPTISGLKDLKNTIGHKNLVVSFDYVEQAVNNVSYHIDEENKKFYLTVKPKKGAEPLEQSSVKFDYTGAEAEMIILFGVRRLNGLAELYVGYEEVFDNATTATIRNGVSSYGTFKLNSLLVSSSCEVVYELLKNLEFDVSAEVATNLLAGIQYETNNFVDQRANADTFEAIAELLRLGARRKAEAFVKTTKKNSENIMAETPILSSSPKKQFKEKKEIKIVPKQQILRPSGLKK